MIRNKTLIRLINRLGRIVDKLANLLDNLVWERLTYCEDCGRNLWDAACIQHHVVFRFPETEDE